jgi:TPR repeat protein
MALGRWLQNLFGSLRAAPAAQVPAPSWTPPSRRPTNVVASSPQPTGEQKPDPGSPSFLPLIFALRNLRIRFYPALLTSGVEFSRSASLVEGDRVLPSSDDAEVGAFMKATPPSVPLKEPGWEMLRMACPGWPDVALIAVHGITLFGARAEAEATLCVWKALSAQNDCMLARQLLKLLSLTDDPRLAPRDPKREVQEVLRAMAGEAAAVTASPSPAASSLASGMTSEVSAAERERITEIWKRYAVHSINCKSENEAYERLGTIGRTITSKDRALFTRASEAGVSEASCLLFSAHLEGWGGPKDKQEACRWLRRAADQGNACAQDTVAGFHMHGVPQLGFPQDGTEATRLYRLAADQGWAKSQSTLGSMLERSPSTADEGFRLMESAAAQGIWSAMFNVAACYETGRHVTQNRDEALRRFRILADQGLEPARHKVRQLTQG